MIKILLQMSLFKKIDKLLIIGPSIRNDSIGGVSVHCERLLDFLRSKEFKFVNKSTNNKNKSSISNLLSISYNIATHKLVHLHISRPSVRLIFIIISRLFNSKVIMTLHGSLNRGNKVWNITDKLTILLANIPVLINHKSYVIAKSLNKKSVFIPAFIPPVKNEKLDDSIKQKLFNIRRDGATIFSTNASNIAFDKNGDDLYGIGFLIEFFSNQSHGNLVISDPSGTYSKYYKSEIEKSKNISILNFPHSYYALLKEIDVFIRNTSTDGDSLSVKEALSHGKPSLCTNVVQRPSKCILFNFNDGISLENAIRNVKYFDDDYAPGNSAESLLNLYNSILKSLKSKKN